MNYNEIAPIIVDTHFKISNILDGDSIIIEKLFSNKEIEIRLYGIDSPEVKRTKKLRQEERESHLPGKLLIELGNRSVEYLRQISPVGTHCTIIQEEKNTTDFYGRSLAYVILPDGSCLNEIMIREGYAKPYIKNYCIKLPDYQELKYLAIKKRLGLYRYVSQY